MVVTTSIMLDRMLLHSRATSISSPGMDNMIPSRVTGTPTSPKQDSCCYRGLLLQEFDDPAQSKLGDGDDQEQQAEGKEKRSESLDPKAKYHAADPPGYERKHAQR